MKKVISFSLLLPVLVLMVSATLVLVSYYRAYSNLTRAPRTGQVVTIQSGQDEIAIPASAVPRMALHGAGLLEQGPITFLNAPGHFIHLVVSVIVG
jgi:hypothetical protein